MSNTLRFSALFLLNRVSTVRNRYLRATRTPPSHPRFLHAIRVFGFIENLIIVVCDSEEDVPRVTPGSVAKRSLVTVLRMLPTIESPHQSSEIVDVLIDRVIRMRDEELIVVERPEERIGLLACGFEEAEVQHNKTKLGVVEEEEATEVDDVVASLDVDEGFVEMEEQVPNFDDEGISFRMDEDGSDAVLNLD